MSATQHLLRLCLLCLLGFDTTPADAGTLRDREIAECGSGEIATWNDGRDMRAIAPTLSISYRHDNAPRWFERSEVETLLARAADAWAQCGIPIKVSPAADPNAAGSVIVQWSEADSGGNFGLANITRRSLSLAPGAFGLLRSRNPGHDARETLQMTIAHEMGHFLGLIAHSRRCVDVLSYYHDGRGNQCFTRDPAGRKLVVEYRHTLPTACDIARCRAINGLPARPDRAPAQQP